MRGKDGLGGLGLRRRWTEVIKREEGCWLNRYREKRELEWTCAAWAQSKRIGEIFIFRN
jgi:hypothetical protein